MAGCSLLDFSNPPPRLPRLVLALLFGLGFIAAAQAQLGTGWTPTSYTKRIHLDDDVDLQTFSWTSYKSVCSPTACADYTYDSNDDSETFRIFDSRSNRSEIRLQNDYSSGMWQFEGYVTIYPPLHDESLFQIFGNTGAAATFLMMRGYSNSSGSIRVMSGSHTIATGVYNQEVRINIIHQYNVSAKFYVNGVFMYEKAHNDPGVVNYWKYGCYGTTSGNVPAIVKWRRVRTFRDGLPPGTELTATPNRLTVAQGSSVTAKINMVGFGGNTTLSVSNVPPGATATFNPTTVTGGNGISTLTITTTGSLAAGAYPLTITGVGGGTNKTETVTLGVVPPPWQGSDIGGPGMDGGTSFSNGVFTVLGGGNDIWGSADKFHFAHQAFSGDFTLSARVDTLQNTDGWAKAGLMARESTNAGAKYVGIYVTPGNGVSIQYRSTNDAAAVDFARNTGFAAPYWVRLTRAGNTFTGFRSADGASWTQVGGSLNAALAGDLLVGLPLTSHDNAQLATATFSSVAMPSNFVVSVSPVARTVLLGSNATCQVALTNFNGFNSAVTFSAVGLPPNTSAGFSPPSLTGTGASTLTITAASNAPAGVYPVSVVGTGGGLTRSNTLTLTVTTSGSSLVWSSMSSSAWDTTSTNWMDAGTSASAIFQQSNAVTFTDLEGVVTNVTLASGFTAVPTTMTVDAATNNYVISGAGKIGGIASVVKQGAGTLTLVTTNDYIGVTALDGGVVRVPWLANGGMACPLGAAASDPANLVFNGGALQWTGSASATVNRGFTVLPGGATWDASPTAPVNLTLSGTIAMSGSGSRALRLSGAAPDPLNLGANALSGVVADGAGGATSLQKEGNNSWALSGNNTYSGGSVVSGGRLRANTSVNAFGTGPVTVTDGGQAYLNVGGTFPNAFALEGIGVTEAAGALGALRLGQNGCTVTNDIVLTGGARITAFGASGAGATLAGRISGDFALELGNSAGSADITNNLAASANAYVLRSSATSDQDESQSLSTKGLNDSNTRIAYVRFSWGSLAGFYSTNDIKSAALRLHLTGNGSANTVTVYGLVDTINGTNDSVWTSAMTWNTQPARTSSPDDIPQSASALPNANTTAILGTASIGTAPAEVTVPLNLTAFRSFLAADSNQQITLLFHNAAGINAGFASLANTNGQLVPTLQIIGSPSSGAGVITLANGGNDWAGHTTLSHGVVKLGAANALPHGEETGNVILNGSSTSQNSIFDLNGFSAAINGLGSVGDTSRCFVTNSSATAATLALGDNDASGTFSGSIRSGTGGITLIKLGAGTQLINGVNTYTGLTLVNAGTLGGGGTLAGPLTVNPGGTLSPGASLGVFTVSNAVSLQGTTFMELNAATQTNDVLRSSGNISFGGTLVLTNLAGTLTTNSSFKLFHAPTCSGAFAQITPASPGAGLQWDTSSLTSGGTLKLAVAPPSSPPVIGDVFLVGTNLVFSGSNGAAGGLFYVLASSNLTVALSNWLVVQTNQFDGTGGFAVTNECDPGQPQQFFRLQIAP